jgi:hypothetical protein
MTMAGETDRTPEQKLNQEPAMTRREAMLARLG